MIHLQILIHRGYNNLENTNILTQYFKLLHNSTAFIRISFIIAKPKASFKLTMNYNIVHSRLALNELC